MIYKWYKTYIKSLRRDIVYLLIADLIFLVVLEFGLKQIPAPFAWFVTVGDIAFTLAVSFIVSFIFYFVQVHLPNIKERENIYPSLAKLFGSIIGTEKILLTELLGIKIEDLSDEVINESVEKLNLYSEAPLILGSSNQPDHRANWIEYCIYRVGRLDQNLKLLIQNSAYLDSECMSLLIRIQNDDTFLDQVRRWYPLCNGKMHKFSYGTSELFIEFRNFIKEQQDYYDRVFALYEAVDNK